MRRNLRQRYLAFLVPVFLAGAQPAAPPSIPAAMQPVLKAITPSNLRGDLSFLASDTLGGRYTPSPGLDVAAEFIASQFRAAGLKPAGDEDFFQTASMVDRHPGAITRELEYSDGDHKGSVPASSLTLFSSNKAERIQRCPVVTFKIKDPVALKGIDVQGKVVVAPDIGSTPIPPKQRMEAYKRSREFDKAISAAGARVEILVGRSPGALRPQLLSLEDVEMRKMPIVLVDSDTLKGWLEEGSSKERTLSLDVPAPDDRKVTLKNVIGILPGSDPKLKDTYILLTAHYDHIGNLETGKGMAQQKPSSNNDRIYNGANDDGSGTVSVIEIARAMSTLRTHPKRTLVFLTFFGEERGDVGSSYYGSHPIFPVAKTVADINLEQVGRTDATDGKQLNNASVTGFDYSDVTAYLRRAGAKTGITVYLNREASDDYFERSDNAALAELGVPAHTLCVAFDYSDYHGLGDEWPKVDYENMAKVDRAVALALWEMSNSLRAPQWNASNNKTASYRDAQNRSQNPGNNQ